ncbi:MAG: hypothetical protein ACXVA8_13090, partial [Bdellovibrionota bacterium]
MIRVALFFVLMVILGVSPPAMANITCPGSLDVQDSVCEQKQEPEKGQCKQKCAKAKQSCKQAKSTCD